MSIIVLNIVVSCSFNFQNWCSIMNLSLSIQLIGVMYTDSCIICAMNYQNRCVHFSNEFNIWEKIFGICFGGKYFLWFLHNSQPTSKSTVNDQSSNGKPLLSSEESAWSTSYALSIEDNVYRSISKLSCKQIHSFEIVDASFFAGLTSWLAVTTVVKRNEIRSEIVCYIECLVYHIADVCGVSMGVDNNHVTFSAGVFDVITTN